VDPHPGGLPVLHRQPADRLALAHPSRAWPQRPLAALPPREGLGRLLEYQRDAIHARAGRASATAGATAIHFIDPDQAREITERAAREFHGGSGVWYVEKQRLRWDILDAFAAAAQQAGLPRTDDFNRGDNEGVGYFEVNQRDGWRLPWSTPSVARGR